MTKNPIFKIKKIIFYGAVIGINLLILLFIISCVWIGYDVKSHCRQTQQDYGGDTCSQSMISLVQDQTRSFSSRNSAIWVLGQLGNPEALPVLKGLYTGYIPEKEPLNEVISQYELKKAIKLTNGGINLTAIFWRYGLK